ncbi:hypothetical protein M8C21_016197 [Ambrosia artemisiifolia]|uniref:Uncharacterized protein n=1 Tax=Ambrosia artemisiifolia TaxID=4212 RepID=A0AAD5C956_AMBAR|nr:hypothetical protein M8C21_016197 [Ambrosia artemisiifolia]
MKRKDAGEVNDDFFDFTLSSPALKIRRLDAELAPIIDEQDTSNPVEFGQPKPVHDHFVEQPMESSPIGTDELKSSLPVNEERAIVLFNSNNNLPSFQSTIPFSISTGSDFLSRFKNPVIWSNRSGTHKLVADETQEHDDDESGASNGCLAVVPWVASHSQHPQTAGFAASDARLSDMMDSDDMDVEDNCNTQQIAEQNNNNYVAASATQDWNQWQQHCMIQQPPNNLSFVNTNHLVRLGFKVELYVYFIKQIDASVLCEKGFPLVLMLKMFKRTKTAFSNFVCKDKKLNLDEYVFRAG